MSTKWKELKEATPLPKKKHGVQGPAIIIRKNGSREGQVLLTPALTSALALSDSRRVRIFISEDELLLGLSPVVDFSDSPHFTGKPTSQGLTFFQGLADALRAVGYELVTPPARALIVEEESTDSGMCVFRLGDFAVKRDTRTPEQKMADAIVQSGNAMKRAVASVGAAMALAADSVRMPDAVTQGLSEAESSVVEPPALQESEPIEPTAPPTQTVEAPKLPPPYFDFKPCLRKTHGEPFEDWLTRMFLHVPALPKEWKMGANTFSNLVGEVLAGRAPEKAAKNLGIHLNRVEDAWESARSIARGAEGLNQGEQVSLRRKLRLRLTEAAEAKR